MTTLTELDVDAREAGFDPDRLTRIDRHLDADVQGGRLAGWPTFEGVGLGIGFSVVDDPMAARYPASRGEFAWGGAASTAFWVDPAERLSGVFMTQLPPSSTYTLRAQHQLVHQAILD